MTIKLLVKLPDGGKGFIRVNEKPKTIGRGEKCDVVLEDDRSSTKHCKIFLDHNRTYLVDVGSKNGTYVNDKKIEEAERIYLKDKILIGKTKLELIREEMTPVEKTYHIRPREGLGFTLPEMSSQNMESIDWTDGQKKEEDEIKKSMFKDLEDLSQKSIVKKIRVLSKNSKDK